MSCAGRRHGRSVLERMCAIMRLYLCGYCGGRVRETKEGWRVHADAGNRIGNISPGDYLSEHHNRKGTSVGPYDLVEVRGVKRYMVTAALVCTNDYVWPMSMPAIRWPGNARWTVRTVTTQ